MNKATSYDHVWQEIFRNPERHLYEDCRQGECSDNYKGTQSVKIKGKKKKNWDYVVQIEKQKQKPSKTKILFKISLSKAIKCMLVRQESCAG